MTAVERIRLQLQTLSVLCSLGPNPAAEGMRAGLGLALAELTREPIPPPPPLEIAVTSAAALMSDAEADAKLDTAVAVTEGPAAGKKRRGAPCGADHYSARETPEQRAARYAKIRGIDTGASRRETQRQRDRRLEDQRAAGLRAAVTVPPPVAGTPGSVEARMALAAAELRQDPGVELGEVAARYKLPLREVYRLHGELRAERRGAA